MTELPLALARGDLLVGNTFPLWLSKQCVVGLTAVQCLLLAPTRRAETSIRLVSQTANVQQKQQLSEPTAFGEPPTFKLRAPFVVCFLSSREQNSLAVHSHPVSFILSRQTFSTMAAPPEEKAPKPGLNIYGCQAVNPYKLTIALEELG
jgi:hypothetical protein